jgi:choline-sulfatase
VLTAAHCVEDANPQDQDVVVGRTNLANTDQGQRVSLGRALGRMRDRAFRLVPAWANRQPAYGCYISDHGDMAGDHGLFWKRSFYEGSARIPMIWYSTRDHSPVVPRRGVRLTTQVSLVDLAPTLTAIGGAPSLPNVDGEDISPLIANAGETTARFDRRPVFSELVIEDEAAIRMVRLAQYKLTYYHGYTAHELFDLDVDPDERRNLWDNPDHAADRERMLRLVLDDWDADGILTARTVAVADNAFMRTWGSTIGAGRMDLWNETGNFYRDRLHA